MSSASSKRGNPSPRTVRPKPSTRSALSSLYRSSRADSPSRLFSQGAARNILLFATVARREAKLAKDHGDGQDIDLARQELRKRVEFVNRELMFAKEEARRALVRIHVEAASRREQKAEQHLKEIHKAKLEADAERDRLAEQVVELKKQLEETSSQNENLKAENAKLLRELEDEKSKAQVESFDVPQPMANHFDDPTRTPRLQKSIDSIFFSSKQLGVVRSQYSPLPPPVPPKDRYYLPETRFPPPPSMMNTTFQGPYLVTQSVYDTPSFVDDLESHPITDITRFSKLSTSAQSVLSTTTTTTTTTTMTTTTEANPNRTLRRGVSFSSLSLRADAEYFNNPPDRSSPRKAPAPPPVPPIPAFARKMITAVQSGLTGSSSTNADTKGKLKVKSKAATNANANANANVTVIASASKSPPRPTHGRKRSSSMPIPIQMQMQQQQQPAPAPIPILVPPSSTSPSTQRIPVIPPRNPNRLSAGGSGSASGSRGSSPNLSTIDLPTVTMIKPTASPSPKRPAAIKTGAGSSNIGELGEMVPRVNIVDESSWSSSASSGGEFKAFVASKMTQASAFPPSGGPSSSSSAFGLGIPGVGKMHLGTAVPRRRVLSTVESVRSGRSAASAMRRISAGAAIGVITTDEGLGEGGILSAYR